MPTNPVAVVCEVPDGLGVIEATGDAGASLLLLGGRPVLLEGNDGFGSVGDEELALLTTDRRPPPDTAAVRGYLRRIRAGARPALVALRPTEDSIAAYLLDGHHKLAAYRQAGISPLLISLAPAAPAPFRLRDYDPARAAFPGESLGRVFAYIRDEAGAPAREPRTS
ncbi:hypothetical protein J7F03_21355 [Streptomyces sp. ISL-43]|uniref:hypothetical protein n=1 Tax=Streptomyces sp. ISL-43 TaxID=2819183 RepID=UPI001BE518BB|nr:hypothetical protein [Streptomyces sp. ISL-43]MBT2449584.1 hypothetical protein [Streptomyces sp. ISL-43]